MRAAKNWIPVASLCLFIAGVVWIVSCGHDESLVSSKELAASFGDHDDISDYAWRNTCATTHMTLDEAKSAGTAPDWESKCLHGELHFRTNSASPARSNCIEEATARASGAASADTCKNALKQGFQGCHFILDCLTDGHQQGNISCNMDGTVNEYGDCESLGCNAYTSGLRYTACLGHGACIAAAAQERRERHIANGAETLTPENRAAARASCKSTISSICQAKICQPVEFGD